MDDVSCSQDLLSINIGQLMDHTHSEPYTNRAQVPEISVNLHVDATPNFMHYPLVPREAFEKRRGDKNVCSCLF